MRTQTYLFCCLIFSALTVGLAACDDESGSNEQDVAADTSSDTADGDRDLTPQPDTSDTTEDEPDAVEDAVAEVGDVSDEEAGPTPETNCGDGTDNDGDELIDCQDLDCNCEVCNDLVNNDADDDVDCADPDCSDDALCPELCGNGLDDDGNADIDCEDAECSATIRCTEAPVTADAYAFEGEVGYIFSLQYPPDDAPCCHDLDGSPGVDNALADLLGVLATATGYDPQLNLSGAINGGDLALLIEWRDLPADLAAGGEVQFNVFRGTPTEPSPPEALPQPVDGSTNTWNDGLGVFQIERDSFDERGPRIRFEGAELTAEGSGESLEMALDAGPHFLDLSIPFAGFESPFVVTLYDARIEMDLELNEVDLDEGTGESLDEQLWTVPAEVADSVVGGGRLGGYVHFDDVVVFLNEGASACACATPTPSIGTDLFDHGEQPGDQGPFYELSCNWSPLVTDTCTEEDSALCPYLNELCGFATLVPNLLDVDANENGANESLSAGLYFDLVGAQLDEPPVVPAE